MTVDAICIEGLSKRFERPFPALRRLLKRKGPDVVDALTDVNLTVHAGEVFGLVGRNGQGKTTLIKSISCLIEPTRGTVRVFGEDSVQNAREVRRKVGLVSADERSFYFRLTGRENLHFFARLYGMDKAQARARIDELAHTFELLPVLERPFQEYSTGNKQRLAIARALLSDPPLLLLDEPTRSLDPISAQGLRAALKRFSQAAPEKTVLITTHNLAEIEELCGRVAILSRGRLIECATLTELREKYAGKERVTVRVRGAVSAAIMAQLPVGVSFMRNEQGDTLLVLEKRRDDDALHALLQTLIAQGHTVLGCDTEHFGLMQVLERVEADASQREAEKRASTVHHGANEQAHVPGPRPSLENEERPL
jgi:ABC-type multidrug transport system ATPase subunit